ncbi:MAG: fibronectin type III domain-containing protein [Armatimonadia bacterium]
MKRYAFLLGMLVTASWCLAQPEEYVCKVVQKAPVLDGRLDEGCWAEAEKAPVFYQLGIGGAPAGNATQVRFVMDAQALYVGIEAPTAPGVPPTASDRGRDGKTWYDDCIEVMLAPGFTTREQYQLCLNALGSMTDLKYGENVSPDESIKWNGAWEANTQTRTGGWSGEMRIPWVDLGYAGRPAQGWVCRVKVGCVAKSFTNSMWPRNETQGFGNPDCWGYLIFGDQNLVTNGDFERGIPEKGTAPGFLYAYYEKEGKGVCSVTEEDKVSGKYAGRLEKFDDEAWFPVFYTAEVPVQRGSTYELKAMIKCDKPFVMRYNAGDKRSMTMPATKGWQEMRLEAVVPDGEIKGLTLGWQLIRTKGVILIDDVVIRRMNEIKVVADAVVVPDNIHRLEELASRTNVKPYPLLRDEDGWYQADRVIFKDTGTGAEIWMLPRSAGSSTRHIYMEVNPWNADGSLICLNTGQAGKGSLLMDAATGRWRHLPFYASSPIWDRRDPERIYFRNYRGHDKTDLWDLAIGNVRTGQYEVTKRFEGDIGLWPMSQDGEKLLVEEELSAAEGGRTSRLWIMDRDGKQGQMLNPHGWCHQTWFTKRPDYSIEFEWEGQKPAGQYMITTDGKVRKLFDQTTGHRAHCPGGGWVAVMAGCAIRNLDTGELKVISDESSDHQTWQTDPNWYCTSSGRYLRRVVAFGSETTQLLGAHNSALKYSTYWTEAHPDGGHDGTKLGYASSMMGDIEYYFLVMGKPSPPQTVKATRQGAQVRLTWEPGKYHKEIKGYLVYRSKASGEWGEQLTPEPVAAREFVDRPQGTAYYRVTAAEHTGLESLPSPEVCSAASWAGPATVYAEAEGGKYQATAVEVFDSAAAGLYGVALGKLRVSPPLSVPVTVPTSGDYRLWVRARGQGGKLAGTVAAKACGSVAVGEKQWQWLAYEQPVALQAGTREVVLQADGPGIVIDRVLLTSDAQYTPQGLGGMDDTAPRAVEGLKAEAAGQYAMRLAWEAAKEADFHHYNVYCGSANGFAVSQERLIASPAVAKFVDWGLKAGTAYYYRVTAVDRSGNESPAGAVATATTAPLAERVFVNLDTKWDSTAQASVELPFTLPADGEFVLWGRVQSLDGEKGGLKVALDGKELTKQGIPFGYISVGHGGPVLKTWLWHCVRPVMDKPEAPLAWTAQAGAHTLTLTTEGTSRVAYEGFVVTNVLGFVPEGIVSFRIPEGK